jgi:hypothetical protein
MAKSESPYTKRSTQRRIEAALAAGLKVVGVAPDFTVLTEDRDNASSAGDPRLTGKRKLRDARERLGL